MPEILKDKIFNDDIQVMETTGNHIQAFKMIEDKNEEYKRLLFKHMREMGYIY